MEKDYEALYADVEERHPWFVARRRLFAALAGGERSARILDVGCGSGMFLAHLEDLGFRRLAGVEPSARLRAKFRPAGAELFGELPAGPYDKVFLLDVLEHIDDDRGTLDDLHRRLEPGGRLYLSVPAHPFLWSHHDDVNQHRRRYRRRELREKLRGAGFELRRLSYWNMFLFLPICLARALRRGGEASDFDLDNPRLLELCGRLLGLENRLLQRFPLPFGVSLIAEAEKPRSRRDGRARNLA